MRTTIVDRAILFASGLYAAFGIPLVAHGITPTPPIAVATEFASGPESSGVLTVEITTQLSVRDVVLSVFAPSVLEVRYLKAGNQRATERKAIGDAVEHSLRVADHLEKGSLSYSVEISASGVKDGETWPVEVRALAKTADGGTAVGHQSLLATVRGGRLFLETPEAYQRHRRVDAQARLREMARKDPGYNIEDVLVGSVVKLDERTLPQDGGSQGDTRVLEAYPSALSTWEREVFVDRSREVVAELDPLTIRGRAFFVDFDGVTRPLVNATVRIMDDDFGPDEHITSTITGWDGRFSAVINNSDGWFQDGRDIYIRILTSNSRFRTEDCSYWPDWTYAWRSNDGSNLSDGTIVDFGSFTLAGDTNGRRAAMVFQRLNAGWNHFTGAGSQDPGFVDSCYPESPTVYDTFWGEVDISGSDFDSRDIIVHEWGHAIQDNAQIWNSWSGDAHSFCGLTSREQAFVEGWATFVALDVFPDSRFNWNPGDSGQELEAYTCAASRSTANGSRDEGRVVAALLDLRDAADDCNGGCGSTCDSNRATTLRLPTIWRDAMWGTIGILTDDAFEFWRELCPAMSAVQRPPGVNIFDYSCIDVSDCRVPSDVLRAPQGSEALSPSDVYPALTRLRDELRQTEAGRRLVDTFSRSASTLVDLTERDAKMRNSLEQLRTQLATTAVWLTNERGEFEDQIPVTPQMLAEFDAVAGALRKQADAELAGNLSYTRLLLAELEGRSVAEIRSKLATVGDKKQ